jgi:hypothetical protein
VKTAKDKTCTAYTLFDSGDCGCTVCQLARYSMTVWNDGGHDCCHGPGRSLGPIIYPASIYIWFPLMSFKLVRKYICSQPIIDEVLLAMVTLIFPKFLIASPRICAYHSSINLCDDPLSNNVKSQNFRVKM